MSVSDHVREVCRLERVPGSQGYFRTQTYISDLLKSFGLNVKLQNFSALPFGSGTNIFAETPATEGARILIGAHYESKKSSGLAADDNASGVALVLELARRLPLSLPITYSFFDLEENFGFGGIKGSKAFAQTYKKEVRKVVIFDLVGGSLAPSLEDSFFQFGSALPPLHHPELNFFHFPIRFLEPLGKIFPRSDYHPFRNKGIEFCFLSSGTPWYYHTIQDLPENLRLSKMENLIESLLPALLNERAKVIPNWSRFGEFLKRFEVYPELDEKLRKINFGSEPGSWKMLRLYKEILPYLRGEGANLWRVLPPSQR